MNALAFSLVFSSAPLRRAAALAPPSSGSRKALRGLAVVQEMLRAGWTTVRVLGDADVHYAHLDVRTAIHAGLFTGPRMTGAGHYLSITGGGGDINFLGPEHQVVADG